ncbi:hypothetical protein NPIL_454601 [Nephila pilipes]|uniref:Uncharacterized protein n=1 Tax=Nephila pilipes TaxID=299642 RepID=A0A8X6U0D3_NEPPI|nr:hypothetical protein NPIL_454601 [Nephila pilipes]
MIRMVQRGEADMAFIGLTISEKSAIAVDFSIPIGALGLSLEKSLRKTTGNTHTKNKQFGDLLEDPVAIIISKIVTKIFLGSLPYVRVKIFDDYLGVWDVVINLRKRFCCRERLNDVLYGIVSGGLYDKWINDIAFRDKLHERLEEKQEEPELQLTLMDIKMVLFALLVGYALALLAFLAEVLIPKYFDIFCS